MEHFYEMVARLAADTDDTGHLIHSTLGATSECGELADMVKAYLFYGKDLDMVNFVEEAGDALFFLQLGLSVFGLDIEAAMQVNIAKLEGVRYKEGFSQDAAKHRRKDLEREAMQEAVDAFLEKKVIKDALKV